jgi:MFS transporter, AAHS family, 4-hydroxybenzoate transporter
MQGGFVGLYPLAARLYPTEIRTTGIGWAIGAGRSGAVLGPIVAGFLVGAGFTMATNFIIFSVPCIIAGIAAMAIKSENVS